MNNQEEIWVDVKGYEGLYSISNKQRIKSYFICRKYQTERIINGKYSLGYRVAVLTKDKKKKLIFVHRLIAEAFIPNPENKPFINHINGIKHDNRIENLEWCTQSENIKHAYLNNLMKNKKRKVLNGNTGEIYQNSEEAAEKLRPHVPADRSVVGTPSQLVDAVGEYKELGFDEICVPDFTMGATAEERLEKYGIFWHEVASQFR
jgi:hypothetical protein